MQTSCHHILSLYLLMRAYNLFHNKLHVTQVNNTGWDGSTSLQNAIRLACFNSVSVTCFDFSLPCMTSALGRADKVRKVVSISIYKSVLNLDKGRQGVKIHKKVADITYGSTQYLSEYCSKGAWISFLQNQSFLLV